MNVSISGGNVFNHLLAMFTTIFDHPVAWVFMRVITLVLIII